MTQKEVLFHGAARERILRGASQLAETIGVTLGPRSRSVLIEQAYGTPLICNDGATIAREFQLKDPVENMGAQVLRQAAEKTATVVGDGTSTATILAEAMFSEGLRNVAAGADAVALGRGLERGLAAAVRALQQQSQPIRSQRKRVQVATISAHGDAIMGGQVAEAMEKIGPDGVITVESSKSTETELEVVEGMQFDRGYQSPYFITRQDRLQCELEDCLILLCEGRISSLADLVPLLDQVTQAGKSLLVISEEAGGEALATLILNHIRGTLRSCAVKAPGFGDRRKDILADIAALTGGHVISEDLGLRLNMAGIADLGQARRVVIERDRTTLIGGGGKADAIADRAALIRSAIGQTTSDYDREKLRERLARLTSGVAVIRVGAATEAALRARKDALEDAISATRAAMAEGIVPGGGLAFLHCISAVEAEAARCRGDEATGVRLLRYALERPTRQIALNSGADGGMIVARMRRSRGNVGFDAAAGRFVDLIEAGIIDPVKVLHIALENAVSVASILLLTEATLTEVPPPAELSRSAMAAGDALSGLGE